MARLCRALLLFITVAVALECCTVQAWGSPKVIRPFQDIPPSYVYVQQAIWYAMKDYNKASKDKYSFRVLQILKSQEQVGEHTPLSLCVPEGGTHILRWLLPLGMENSPRTSAVKLF